MDEGGERTLKWAGVPRAYYHEKSDTYRAEIDGQLFAWPSRLIWELAYGQCENLDLEDDKFLCGDGVEAARRGVML